MYGQASVTIRSSNFYRNGAEKGGGVWMVGNLTVNVEDSLFQDNIASSHGGGVFLVVSCGVLFGVWVRINEKYKVGIILAVFRATVLLP